MQAENNKKQLIRDILQLLLFVVVLYLVTSFLLKRCYIASPSMEPTLMTGDVVLFLNDAVTGVRREDIIAFDQEGMLVCKRVIGVGGDHILIKDGYAFVNGERMDSDSYTQIPASTFAGLKDEYDVPEDTVFVMGDNRCDSFDSRFWDNPFVDVKSIKGRYLTTLVHS